MDNNSSLRNVLINRDGHKCSICGASNISLQIHHIRPLNEGGNNEIGNLELVCSNCHTSQSNVIQEYEFENYLYRLLSLHDNFRYVKTNALFSQKAWILADIVAEELIEGKWQPIIIECKSSTNFTLDRLRASIAKLKNYQKIAPNSKLILAFPGTLSSEATKILEISRISIWDISCLSLLFVKEIPQVQHPIFSPLFLTTRPSSAKIKEEQLINELSLCSSGKNNWASYQNLVGAILEHLFCPPLTSPLKEMSDALAINRRDFVFPNYSVDGFWTFLRDKYIADYIVVDAKNYKKQVSKEQVLQIANYLKLYGAGLFGLIVCRTGGDRSCLATARETWIIENKLILILSDYDLKEMLTAKLSGLDPTVIVRQKIEDFRLAL
jgi:hypothetical protein